MDSSGIHLQTDLVTTAESRQEYLTTGKEYIEPCKMEPEPEESTILTTDYTTKLQSLRQYGTGIKTEI